ncbi:heme A synthase [Streptantibioticus rubrisoli]|uniref:COX15/CtaA family protein n=1 Tax=Streptantibioticus rubrisoli TaxID=1387313 RepID=A0ABT1P524_9ACTN|nr:COX15/CtaA family protein [Streptantibioticus rubrisoli]MCQ4040469.1 COX15/CtaA family protein [Streptantibioticus rubrisoli]
MASILIVVTGGVVRLTGSGLGCPKWPMCTGDTLAPTAAMGVHGAIEFSNRILTGVLCAVVGWLIIAARLQKVSMPSVLRGSWLQFWVVVLNAVVGGVTVLMRLSPYIVAAHFLAAMLLLTAAVITWERVRQHQVPPREPAPPPSRVRTASVVLVAATALLVVAGTLVTGAGPHAGDSSDVARMPFDWTLVAVVHGALAVVVLGAAGFIWSALTGGGADSARRRTACFLAVVLAQGAVGLWQSLSGLPGLAVGLHLLGASLVWAGTLRVYCAVRMPDSAEAVVEFETVSDSPSGGAIPHLSGS